MFSNRLSFSKLIILSWMATWGWSWACTQQREFPSSALLPRHFPKPIYSFEPDSEQIALGKQLFYEPMLSRDTSISCASCHQLIVAFADSAQKLSRGVSDQLGDRNTLALFNLIWQPVFFWDGGGKHIDFSPLRALTDTLEMDMALAEVLDRLQKNPRYQLAFKKAFATDSIQTIHFLKALRQFMSSLISAESKFDHFLQKKASLSPKEALGYRLFQRHCVDCHTGVLFSDFSFQNNGLDPPKRQALGRAEISQASQDQGKFRVPSLRNVALTAPYMHDGRFATLSEVLNHYSQGLKMAPNLAPQLRRHFPGFMLSEEKKAQIIAFLHTLTDSSFVKNKDFAKPFP